MAYRLYHVYILRCSDGSYYTGITNNVERRFEEHKAGVDSQCYTFDRHPLVFVYSESFQSVQHAISREKQIKKWSRKKKEALINGDYDALRELSSNRVSKKE